MNKLIKFLLIFILIISSCLKDDKEILQPNGDEQEIIPSKKTLSIKSCDLSVLPQIRFVGIITKNLKGQPEDMLTTLKSEGVNTIRLRLWNKPSDEYSGFDEVMRFSKEIKSKGMKVWITVHYSDTWADPGNQQKPHSWESIAYQQLKDSVYDFTKKIITEINPDIIQIGNEINNGFLWPEGSYSNINQMIDLLKQGIKAVRDNSNQTKIMLHYAGFENVISFFSGLRLLDFDIIALSYYPCWHGKDLNILQSQLNAIGTQFNKDIVIAETAYPFTFGWNDWTNNIIGNENQILSEFPATILGQRDYLDTIRNIVMNAPKGIGFCYWGGEWISFKGDKATNGSSWENQALWDFNNQALPAIRIFND